MIQKQRMLRAGIHPLGVIVNAVFALRLMSRKILFVHVYAAERLHIFITIASLRCILSALSGMT